MGKFRYRALSAEQMRIEGKYDAESEDEVMNFIESNGMYPLLIEEIIQSKEIKLNLGVNKKVKTKDIAVMSRQFHTMIQSGVPIIECLNILSVETENEKLRRCFAEIAVEVKKGRGLSECMKKHDAIFPSLLINLIEAGEVSGSLEMVMDRMASYYEKEAKVANKVRNAMIYPCVLILVCIVAVAFILMYAMPTFVDVFKDTGISLPWNTRLLLWMSDFLKNNWLLLLILMILCGFGLKSFLKTEKGQFFASRVQLKIPFIKKMNQLSIVSHFTRTLSMLMVSGIPLVDSIAIVSNVVKNKVAGQELMKVNEKVSRGEELNTSISATGIFPNMLCSMVKIGEETGSLDQILRKTADFYDEELDTKVQATVALMEPALIVVMGLIIGFIVISIMLPMFDMYEQI